VTGQYVAVRILWMVLTRRLFKVEDDGGAHKGGLAVRRFEEVDPEPAGGRGGESGLLLQLAAGRLDEIFPGSTWPAGWLKRRWPDLLFHQQEAALPVHQGGHGEAGGQRWVIAHKDSLSCWLCPGGALDAIRVAFIQRAWWRGGRRAVVRPPLRLPGAGCPALAGCLLWP
jgi:hypothetical protein